MVGTMGCYGYVLAWGQWEGVERLGRQAASRAGWARLSESVNERVDTCSAR